MSGGETGRFDASADDGLLSMPRFAPMTDYDFSGRALNQRYALKRRIGAGAFATVYLAHDLRMYKRKVAVKVLNPEHTRNPSNVERFLQEVKVASRLDGPYRDRVVKIIDQGRCDVARPGLLFLVMEHVDGVTLHSLLFSGAGAERRRRPLPWRQAATIIRELCKALATLHEAGVVHRDIKPGNCILEQRPDGDFLKLLDLGIVKVLPNAEMSGDHPRTHPEFVLGTPRYMAPEQFGGPCSDPRVDLYAAGIMLYEFLAGDVPSKWYERKGAAHPYMPIPPSEANPEGEIPPQLDALVLRAIAFEPGKRFQTAGEFSEALSQVLGERAAPTLRAAPQASLPIGGTVPAFAAVDGPPGGIWSALRWWVVASTTCTAMIFVFAFAAVLRRAESRPALDLEPDDSAPSLAPAVNEPPPAASDEAAVEAAPVQPEVAPVQPPEVAPVPPEVAPAKPPEARPARSTASEGPAKPTEAPRRPKPKDEPADELMPIWPSSVAGVQALAQKELAKACGGIVPAAKIAVVVTVDAGTAKFLRLDFAAPVDAKLRDCVVRRAPRAFQFAGLKDRQRQYKWDLDL